MTSLALATEYRVPKRRVSAEVLLLGHPRKVVTLFLHEVAETHAGAERPSDLLNGEGTFFPAIEPPGKLVLLQRDAVMVISVAAEAEFLPSDPEGSLPDPAQATKIPVEVILQDGSHVRGTVQFAMPQGRDRLIDFMNAPDRFITVREENLARLINKRRIVRIAVL
jgi:hypothetical protein